MPTGEPFIPETITVHLGRPNEDAQDVTVAFSDYVKNVASSEIYPTWPEASLRANIYVIMRLILPVPRSMTRSTYTAEKSLKISAVWWMSNSLYMYAERGQ